MRFWKCKLWIIHLDNWHSLWHFSIRCSTNPCFTSEVWICCWLWNWGNFHSHSELSFLYIQFVSVWWRLNESVDIKVPYTCLVHYRHSKYAHFCFLSSVLFTVSPSYIDSCINESSMLSLWLTFSLFFTSLSNVSFLIFFSPFLSSPFTLVYPSLLLNTNTICIFTSPFLKA